jgi:hypothetical protein
MLMPSLENVPTSESLELAEVVAEAASTVDRTAIS